MLTGAGGEAFHWQATRPSVKPNDTHASAVRAVDKAGDTTGKLSATQPSKSTDAGSK
jgi:hypothetical protein